VLAESCKRRFPLEGENSQFLAGHREPGMAWHGSIRRPLPRPVIHNTGRPPRLPLVAPLTLRRLACRRARTLRHARTPTPLPGQAQHASGRADPLS
jgi:hypothetical protein